MMILYKHIPVLWIISMLILTGCREKEYPVIETPEGNPQLLTDKARYNPGEKVSILLTSDPGSEIMVKYTYLSEVIATENYAGCEWKWDAPVEDYRGYMAEAYSIKQGDTAFIATVGIDVSSDWNKFPRYGFLSSYGDLSDPVMESVIAGLNRFHINGIQFYDWHYKHHLPLPGESGNPDDGWNDIINRKVLFSTVENYIEQAHDHNMAAMFYNLANGALERATFDGVNEDWFLFRDKSHSSVDAHILPQPPFTSDIFLLDPSNTEWQDYMSGQNNFVYESLGFDGFHIDQLGNRGDVYNYNGEAVNLPQALQSFAGKQKDVFPGHDIVVNAVNQYGQDYFAGIETGFLYTEVWSPNEDYADLAAILDKNSFFSGGGKNSVLAAYVNYGLADNPGYFNTPSVLLTDAVIFSFGGSHIELGEHMLGKEYFPNNNLVMRADLRERLKTYYDFLVAYQNLLRDGGLKAPVNLVSGSNMPDTEPWPPRAGNVSYHARTFTGRKVIHLLNFSDALHLSWRDNSGNQPYPEPIREFSMQVDVDSPVGRVWYASPDYLGGAAIEIPFSLDGSVMEITIPLLEYWSMIVIETF